MAAKPTLMEDWRQHEKSLLTKIKNREKELTELHHEFITLQRHDRACMQMLMLLGNYAKAAK